ncbi:MAG: hypothetical protein NC115_01015 [Bacteroidales bacterium]|nr:hypothetical protein [Bacteroidales bacterium]
MLKTLLKLRRLSVIIGFVFLGAGILSAQNQDKGLTLKMENVSIEQVTKAIEQQSRYLFVYKGGGKYRHQGFR